MLEVSTLFRSDPRKSFLSNMHYFDAHEKLLLNLRADENVDKAHPFIFILYDSCVGCHSYLTDLVSFADKYKIITANKAIFHGSVTEIDVLRKRHSKSILYYIPLLPSAKIDNRLLASEGCKLLPSADVDRNKVKLKLAVVIAPISELELEIFSNEMMEDKTLDFTFDFSEIVPNSERSAYVTIANCMDAEMVAIKLSLRREVLWIEQSHEIYASNLWATGICQSGAYDEAPIYYAGLTGIMFF